MTKSLFDIRRLEPSDVQEMRGMLNLMGIVFEEPHNYIDRQPDDRYLRDLLARDTFAAFVAVHDQQVVGGITAYVFPKYEQARNEVYIYDLAVDAAHRRQGIATSLIGAVQDFAADIGAWIVMIQADKGDVAPDTLYSKLGNREEVLYFDLPVPAPRSRAADI